MTLGRIGGIPESALFWFKVWLTINILLLINCANCRRLRPFPRARRVSCGETLTRTDVTPKHPPNFGRKLASHRCDRVSRFRFVRNPIHFRSRGGLVQAAAATKKEGVLGSYGRAEKGAQALEKLESRAESHTPPLAARAHPRISFLLERHGPRRPYSTVTDFARLRGWSASLPMMTAV
jgi:hypothetical protein